ncbi:MAG: glycerol transporter [Bathelium mastoideum]|nr:MAG: glycerol transporter [Bathelium mastoideum]
MSWLYYLKQIYSLDTLDARFVPKEASNEVKIDPAQPTPEELKTKQDAGKFSSLPEAQKSRWREPEFFVHYLIFAICVPLMFYTPYEVSQASDPRYQKFEPLLSPGWILGRKVDNSDAQYASFRDNIPYMAILLILHPLLRKLYDSFWRSSTYTQVKKGPGDDRGLTQGLSASAAADARMEQRIAFDSYFTLIFIAALYGVSALKILFIVYLNYKIAKDLPKSYVPAATWVFNVGLLFVNELSHGYPFERIAALVSSSPSLGAGKEQAALVNWGRWLDSYGGLIPRWEVLFKITTLRLISFNFDYYWSLDSRTSNHLEKKQLDPSSLSERDRVSIPAKPTDYTFRNYFAYTLYSPLYIAGPVLTFNDYVSQLRYPLPSITSRRILFYGLRFLLTVLSMELILHFIYAVAISKADPDWSTYTPFQLSMLAYFNLHIIWLKLLIPWRFFRLWALCDGIDPPENMVRCMSDNYSALGFWRSWHRSLNRWIVRYIFIPLGGSRSAAGQTRGRCEHPVWVKVRAGMNFVAVFTFVALWHDIQLRLLAWGWLIVLFILPEVVATQLFPRRKFKDQPDLYRWLCGIGAVGNIMMMMAANLVGFAVGLDGLKGLVQGIAGSWSGVVFLMGACGALFTGAQVMFEVREEEKRHGINMKC